jgi:hypothetical protein
MIPVVDGLRGGQYLESGIEASDNGFLKGRKSVIGIRYLEVEKNQGEAPQKTKGKNKKSVC